MHLPLWAIVIAICLLHSAILLGASTINYVQGASSDPQTPEASVSVTFTAAQAAGDLNVVVVGWNDSTATVSKVTDKIGNTYTLAVGPTIQSGIASQSIYYAKNITAAAAGANIVTVTFSKAASFPDIRILEYGGADPNNPVDVTAASSGSSTTSKSGSVATTNATDLIFGANLVQGTTTGAGSGFTKRLLTSPDGDIAEDKMVTTTGSYSATAPVSPSGKWIMQMVAFRTPSAGGTAPTVTSVSPNTGSTAGGTAVTITGTNFASGATVTFGGNAATRVVAVSATSITCNAPSGNAGAVTVTVTVSGSSGSLSSGFTYIFTLATPTFSPVAGTYSSAQSVTINLPSGSVGCYTLDGSTPAATTPGTCSHGTLYSTAVTVSSSLTLKAIATETGFINSGVATAAYTISTCVQNLAIGTYTLCGEAYNVITSGTQVTTTYSPATSNGIIAWATWCYNSSCNSSTSGITATIGDNVNATESCFTASPHSPFITDANGAAQGSGDFQEHYVWYCPSIPAGVTSFTVTPSRSGLYYLQLQVSEWKAGSLAASCSPISACFENVDNFGQAGNTTGGTTATVTTSGSTVNANDLIWAGTQVPCCTFTGAAGTGYTGITVAPSSNPGMVSEAKAVTATGIQTATTTWVGGSTPWFGVIVPIVGAQAGSPTPTVTNVSPNTGSTAGGTAVTITGTNFASGATVTFGGTAATNVVVASSTSITATTPAGGAGAVTVTVTVAGQSGSLTSGFTYIAAPTVTSVSPSSGSTGGGTAVTITGTNFATGSTVTFGGNSAVDVTVASSTSITATTPAGSAGAVTVAVTVSGVRGSLNDGYTYSSGGSAVPTLLQAVSESFTWGYFTGLSKYVLPIHFPTNANNIVLVAVNLGTSIEPSGLEVTDNASTTNTYALLASQADTNGNWVGIFCGVQSNSASMLTITTSSGNLGTGYVSAAMAEFSNVATGSGGCASADQTWTHNIATNSSTSVTAGSATETTSTSGDLIWMYAVMDNGVFPTYSPGSQSGITWALTPGSAQVPDGNVSQWGVYGSTSPINPTMSLSADSAYIAVAVALKPASSGSGPSSGIHVAGVEHIDVASTMSVSGKGPNNASTSVQVQMPSQGNLLVLQGAAAYLYDPSSVTDTAGNTWYKAIAQDYNAYAGSSYIWYACNTAPSSTNVLTITMPSESVENVALVLYDVVNASTATGTGCYDNSNYTMDSSNSTGNVTIFSNTVTPAGANEEVFANVRFQGGNAVSGTYDSGPWSTDSGNIFASDSAQSNQCGNDSTQYLPSPVDECNGFFSIITTGSSALSLTSTQYPLQTGQTASLPGEWVATWAAFK